MSVSNSDYLYQNLPSRFRREDKDLFLKRYLQWFGETLDGYDQAFNEFFENINPDTANEAWVEFWLENLFGWSWFPSWFTTADKRRLYANFAKHLARRGTQRGIERWLLDFGIVARVHTRSLPWGEFVWGETNFLISEPLNIIVEILFIKSPPEDLQFWGEGAWGEFFYSEPKTVYSDKEILDLIRYVQPQAQDITVVYSLRLDDLETVPFWEQLDEPPHWQQIDW